MYISEEGHSCLRKSSHLLGLGEPLIIPVDDRYKMDVHALHEAVMADRNAGLQPFCVVGSAGTVNTGAVDPLDELADFCAEQGLWLHVDGAYGAFGILDPNVTHLYTASNVPIRWHWIHISGWQHPSSAVVPLCEKGISCVRHLAWCLPIYERSRTRVSAGYPGLPNTASNKRGVSMHSNCYG